MEFECIALSFRGFLPAPMSTSHARERWVLACVSVVPLRHLPWLASQVYTLKHDIINVQSLMPGLLLAIRKVVRLKVPPQFSSIIFFILYCQMLSCCLSVLLCQTLVYGLEKFLWSFEGSPLAALSETSSPLFIGQSGHLDLITKTMENLNYLVLKEGFQSHSLYYTCKIRYQYHAHILRVLAI